jgi:hypothetical protein
MEIFYFRRFGSDVITATNRHRRRANETVGNYLVQIQNAIMGSAYRSLIQQ